MFIVLEGIDGSGTTTQTGLLAAALRASGREVVATHEPSQGPVGLFLRAALTKQLRADDAPVTLDWTAMALLFAADRMDHVRREIAPALARGAIVLSDRYDLSSLIYQSETSPDGASSLPWLRSLNLQALRPDLTLVLCVSPEIAEARRLARGGTEELFERPDLQRRLARLYAEAATLVPREPLCLLNAEQSVEALFGDVLSLVRARLDAHTNLPEPVK